MGPPGRVALFLLHAALGAAVWGWRRPSRLAAASALLASGWALSVALLLATVGQGGTFDRLDLLFERVLLWGALPALALPRRRAPALVVAALPLDMLLARASGLAADLSPAGIR